MRPRARARLMDMVAVLTADPLHGQVGSRPWGLEKATLTLVADVIADLSEG